MKTDYKSTTGTDLNFLDYRNTSFYVSPDIQGRSNLTRTIPIKIAISYNVISEAPSLPRLTLITQYITIENIWKLEAIFGKEHVQDLIVKNKYFVDDSFIESLFSDSDQVFYADKLNSTFFVKETELFKGRFGELHAVPIRDLLPYGIDFIEEIIEKGYVSL